MPGAGRAKAALSGPPPPGGGGVGVRAVGRRRYPPPALNLTRLRHEKISNGFEGLSRKAKTRIWPGLSYMCHICTTAASLAPPLSLTAPQEIPNGNHVGSEGRRGRWGTPTMRREVCGPHPEYTRANSYPWSPFPPRRDVCRATHARR